MFDAVQSFAHPWSAKGHGARARVGIVVSHGFTGNPSSVRPYGEALAERGFRVEVPRLPGHGTHVLDMVKTRYDDWRAEVAASRDRLLRDCDVVVLAGLSMGATIVLDLTGAEPSRVAGCIAINPAVLDREGLVAKLAPLIARAVPVIPAAAAGLAENDVAKPGGDERAYSWVPTKAAGSLMDALPRVRRQLSGCKVPLLIAYSPQDHSVPCANALAVRDLVGPGGDVQTLPLERSFHVATLDWDLDLLVERSVAFADRVAQRQSQA